MFMTFMVQIPLSFPLYDIVMVEPRWGLPFQYRAGRVRRIDERDSWGEFYPGCPLPQHSVCREADHSVDYSLGFCPAAPAVRELDSLDAPLVQGKTPTVRVLDSSTADNVSGDLK